MHQRKDKTQPAMESRLDEMIDYLEKKPKSFPGLIHADSQSKPRRSFAPRIPERETSLRNLTLKQSIRLTPAMSKLFSRMWKGKRMYNKPVYPTVEHASDGLFAELKQLAQSMGAVDMKFIRDIPQKQIFKEKSIPYRHALIFTVEMDNEPIQTAPSFDCFLEVNKGYGNLAAISNALSKHLRELGYSAYPSTALGGQMDYVALAEMAGLGAIGYHGLLLTPQAGARVRISTIFTNIDNFPVETDNPHLWVRDFCQYCRKCVRSCPASAILPEPQSNEHGDATCIDYTKCVPYFSANFGCAKCIQVCPFSTAGYEKIHKGFLKKKKNQTKVQETAQKS